MTDSRSKGLGAAARVTALAGSVMDLHVRIALQEVDKEKRRLVSGVVFLVLGMALFLFALFASEAALIVWMQKNLQWDFISAILIMALIDLVLAGLSFRIGGRLAKGPYLPETWEGLTKTTRAILGRS